MLQNLLADLQTYWRVPSAKHIWFEQIFSLPDLPAIHSSYRISIMKDSFFLFWLFFLPAVTCCINNTPVRVFLLRLDDYIIIKGNLTLYFLLRTLIAFVIFRGFRKPYLVLWISFFQIFLIIFLKKIPQGKNHSDRF